MNFALVSVLVPAMVALIVSMISPVFTHLIWKHQKRKEQQLTVAERFAALHSELIRRYGLQAYLFAEALDLPFSKIPKLK
jgi:hypothetical protein